MTTTTALKDQLNSKSNAPAKAKEGGMQLLLKKMEAEIAKALPKHVESERFQRVALTAFNSNPALQQCDPTSFLAAMMTSAQLGVEPNTPLGQAYLIPYGKNVQFQLSYKGMIDLAQRSGQFKTIYAHEVYANDDFDIEYGLDQKIKHKPAMVNRGEVIGFYAVYKLQNGGESFVFMSKDDILTFAQAKSKTFKSGPWQTDFNAMAKKTVIKQLLKYAPLSVEMNNTIVSDESVRKEINEDMTLVENEVVAEY
ncbi:MAG: recombinase RecT [Bacilli bacterium]